MKLVKATYMKIDKRMTAEDLSSLKTDQRCCLFECIKIRMTIGLVKLVIIGAKLNMMAMIISMMQSV